MVTAIADHITFDAVPMPLFSNDLDVYELIKHPTVLEKGNFPLIVTRAAWQIFDQRQSTAIEAWTDNFVFDHQDDEEWTEFEAMAPNGYALQALVMLNERLSPGDYLIAGLVANSNDDVEQPAFSAYYGLSESGADEFKTYIGIDVPTENGLTETPNFMGSHEYSI